MRASQSRKLVDPCHMTRGTHTKLLLEFGSTHELPCSRVAPRPWDEHTHAHTICAISRMPLRLQKLIRPNDIIIKQWGILTPICLQYIIANFGITIISTPFFTAIIHLITSKNHYSTLTHISKFISTLIWLFHIRNSPKLLRKLWFTMTCAICGAAIYILHTPVPFVIVLS